ncbi:MAG: YqgE/AlgH family protein, partial [Proteobacteria bacterium]|nr:YqgE/AlgH family protein [Pseudomonadota bacterium]
MTTETGYLDGHLLVAMPTMSDPRFARTVIYLCAHTADGAMGLV